LKAARYCGYGGPDALEVAVTPPEVWGGLVCWIFEVRNSVSPLKEKRPPLGGAMVVGGLGWTSLPFAAAGVIALALVGQVATIAIARKTGGLTEHGAAP